jgi:uncharacterized protein (TIGR02118 family)
MICPDIGRLMSSAPQFGTRSEVKIGVGAKLIVAHPQPTDVEAFESVYEKEHVPMAVANLTGKTRIVSTRVLQSPQATPHFHRIVEVHFPSMEALKRCAESTGGRETLANAVKISSGGPPGVMIAEEELFVF